MTPVSTDAATPAPSRTDARPPIPLVRPTTEPDGVLLSRMDDVLRSGMLTNGAWVRRFEEAAAEYLGVRHVVAVSNCTAGLLLVLRSIGRDKDIVVPGFTFMATGHVGVWNAQRVRFADSDPRTWTLDPASCAGTAPDADAVVGMHTFGTPCDVDALRRAAGSRTPVVLDAAHGFGSRYPDGTMVGGKGLAEVFSLSPTKPLSAGEGGLVTTGDDSLAEELRIGRDYGNPGDYDARFVGLNARMPELSALVGLSALERFPYWLERRTELVRRYRHNLDDLPGLAFQDVPEGARSSYKDLGVQVDPEAFGTDRAGLARVLSADGISSRFYFDPPLHRQTAYRSETAPPALPVTDRLAARMITLPLYSHMPEHDVDRVCDAVRRAHVDGPAHAV
ncbi:aminotransferase DegT [Streptomyces litmocidini]|uniref:DegT/DnrJ/EryC1/StrS family aminotransferase n=1 Tax=Streptomyces litmocidini TaxID=67318 RepID=UPI00167C701D|nr:DegT/DnrJ/EryC1/StrS family aminotransferase [Streptomyces litmocidini]GGU80571.1 aminotransferase DegT [Streptomyces litmocidini]